MAFFSPFLLQKKQKPKQAIFFCYYIPSSFFAYNMSDSFTVKDPFKFILKRSTTHQFRFSLPDPDILTDVARVILSYLNCQSAYSSYDRHQIRIFLQTFIPLCFQVNLQDLLTNDESDDDEEDRYSTVTDDSSDTHSTITNTRDEGLLRDVLTKNMDDDEIISEERSQSPSLSVDTNNRRVIDVLTSELPVSTETERTFFCNTPFFCFFRQYEVKYVLYISCNSLTHNYLDSLSKTIKVLSVG